MTGLHNEFSKPGWGQDPIYMIHKINDTLALTTLSSTPVASQLKTYGIDDDITSPIKDRKDADGGKDEKS